MTTAHHQKPSHSFDCVLDAARAAGARVRVTRAGAAAKVECLAHEDRKSSVSVTYDAASGHTMVHCFACGADATETVLAAWGLAFSDLYDEDRPQRPRGTATPRPRPKVSKPKASPGAKPKRLCEPSLSPAGEPTITPYDYVDGRGRLVAQNVRYMRDMVDEATGEISRDKEFRQRFPADDGGWLKRQPQGFEPVPYRLPEVLAAISDDEAVWLVEGEKDAEAARGAGVCATTNAAGADQFTAGLAAHFTGATVKVVLDRDGAGARRGVKVEQLLHDAGASRVELLLPVPTHKGADLTDHLGTGHDLTDLLPITAEDADAWAIAWDAHHAAHQAHRASNEATARAERASDETTTAKARRTEAGYAARWALDAGRHLYDAHERAERLTDRCPAEARALAHEAVTAAREAVAAAYAVAGTEMPADVAALLDDQDGDDLPSNVVEHPSARSNPDPDRVLHTTRGRWRYTPGDGIYMLMDESFVRVARLPHVQGTIRRRDGSGRLVREDYLLAADVDEPGVIVNRIEVLDGTWSNRLGIPIPAEDRIVKNLATAIFAEAEDASHHEATPRVNDDGRVDVALPDTLPTGYLATADVDRDEALRTWAQIVDLTAQAPVMALALGATAASPWLGSLEKPNGQSFVFSLYGDAARGKTTVLELCGSVFGDGISRGASTVVQMFATTNFLPQHLGQLGCLPGFFDELGEMDVRAKADLVKMILAMTNGASKGRSTRDAMGAERSRSWYGLAMMSGNGRLLDGQAAGKFAGANRRVIEFGTPITNGADHADAFPPLLHDAYGHIGAELLDRYDQAALVDRITAAEQMLVLPDDAAARSVARHLCLCLAGAMLLDEVTGHDGRLLLAAVEAASDFLDEFTAPKHDADQLIDAMLDSITDSPTSWPSEDDYLAGAGYTATTDRPLRLDGLGGVRSNDDGRTWIGLTNTFLRRTADQRGLDTTVALAELHRRGWLDVTPQARRSGEWQNRKRIGGTTGPRLRVYLLHLPDDVIDPPDDKIDPPEPPCPGTSPGSVPGDVPGANPPLTCDVPDVPGDDAGKVVTRAREGAPLRESDATTHRPPEREQCVVCGQPALGRDPEGRPVHLVECVDELERRDTLAQQPPAAVDDQQLTLDEATDQQQPEAPAPAVDESGGEARLPSLRQWPACVAHTDGVHLGCGRVEPYPGHELPTSYAQLLDLADALGVGFSSRRDVAGPTVLVTAALARRVGAHVDLPGNVTHEQADRMLDEAGGALPWLDDARGWTLGDVTPRLRAWAIAHHEASGRTGRLVHLAYCIGQQAIPGAADAEAAGLTPAGLAAAFGIVADQLGIGYRVSAATTGLDLMRLSRMRESAKRRRSSSIPRLDRPVTPPAPLLSHEHATRLLSPLNYARRPLDSERGLYVHEYDVRGSYPRAAGIYLGDDSEPTHLLNDAVDGFTLDQRRPGIVRVARPATWDHPGLTSPWNPTGRTEQAVDEAWMPTTVATWLEELGYPLEVREAYVWETSHRYLEPWLRTYREALKAIGRPTGDDPVQTIAATTLKATFNAGLGKLSSASLRGSHTAAAAYARPDWHSLVCGQAYHLTQRVIVANADASGRWPLWVNTDAVAYASDDPDPVKAWPGAPDKLNDGLGGFRHQASGKVDDLADALKLRPYTAALKAITTAGDQGLLTPADQWEG